LLADGSAGAPADLAATGLYSDFATRTIDPRHAPYSPQYPLWTDGATKRRWLHLPAGTAIDASVPDAWVFPVGTRLWKEFSFGGRPVETRYMERRPDGSWLYATYVWSPDGDEARLASPRGVRGMEVASGVRHDVPGLYDCRSCHEGQPAQVLGVAALQLSPDRDPEAPHAQAPEPGSVDLAVLVERGWLRGLPLELLRTPPRIVAPDADARAALGYLHGNCAHCHNARGPLAELGFSLEVPITGAPAGALTTAMARAARFHFKGEDVSARIAPGDPDARLLVRRMASREAYLQMPPLGTRRVDEQALALIRSWIHLTPSTTRKETGK
jgi:hypothetical protein